jgi:hypothetical protein
MRTGSHTVSVVRRATPADLPSIGRLGALLVEEHYDFDPRRFLAANMSYLVINTGMATKLSSNHLILRGSLASAIVSSLTSLPVP